MRNKVFGVSPFLVIVTFFIVGYAAAPTYAQLFNQDLKGLKAGTLEEVLALPDDEIDLATAILLISQKAHKDLDNIKIDVHRYRNRVDEIASALLSRMGKEKSPEAIIRAMNHYVFEELKFSPFGEAKDSEPASLTFVLDEKKGNCFGLSILYLSIAERIGFSLYGAVAPDHFFVRYEDNVKRINIETTEKGRTPSDDSYIERFKIPEGSQFYLKSLGKKEIIGAFLSNVGNDYAKKGQYDRAISDFNKALEINPRDGEAYSNRGIAYARKGQYAQAISDLNKALKINPRDAKAYNNRGIAYKKKDQYGQAISDFNKALEINPRYPEAYFNKALTYDMMGRIREAIEAYRGFIQNVPPTMYQRQIELARKRIKELER